MTDGGRCVLHVCNVDPGVTHSSSSEPDDWHGIQMEHALRSSRPVTGVVFRALYMLQEARTL